MSETKPTGNTTDKKDPLHLPQERPPYVEDQSGSDDPDNQPDVGTDPMGQPQEGVHKTVVAPDPEAVRRARGTTDPDRPDAHRVRKVD